MPNEWVLHDLRGDNGPKEQGHAGRLLLKLIESDDRISVMANSPWSEKAWDLMRYSDPIRSGLSRLLRLGVLLNSSKCTIVYAGEVVPVDADLAAQTPLSDLYLIQTYLAAHGDVLVTSDQKLRERIAPFPQIRTSERADFLRSYAGCQDAAEYCDRI